MHKNHKINYIDILLILIFILGLGVLLYPNISDYINRKNSSKAISEYDEATAKMEEEQREEMLSAAKVYNDELIVNAYRFTDMTDDEMQRYMSLLNIDGKGMMGYLELVKLGEKMPIYHTTDEKVLQTAVGHVEGSSLPIGGVGTHCVLSGHRGLPTAVLFTNLDRMEVGDIFYVLVLGEKHEYIVDQIKTVLPDDMTELAIDPNEDYCTLITCTPYGVNTHRLLVRGKRVVDGDNTPIVDSEEGGWSLADLTREQIVNAIAIGMVGILGALLIPFFLLRKKKEPGLRPWDDTFAEVIDAAIIISEKATRDNWEVLSLAKEADWLADLRRWTDECETIECNREWNDYNEYECDEGICQWDDEILDKVSQDWSQIDAERYRAAVPNIDLLHDGPDHNNTNKEIEIKVETDNDNDETPNEKPEEEEVKK